MAADSRQTASDLANALDDVGVELGQRAWTLLVQIDFEVQEVGTCLLRRDPKRDDWFPSLYAAGRSGRPREKKDEAAGWTPKDGALPKPPIG